jgi:hypothetical protein
LATLNAILKPLVDHAVAACAQARQASLRSDADNEKFAKAQMEGGYWLARHRQLKETLSRRTADVRRGGVRRWRPYWRSRSKPQRLALAKRGGGQRW